jgi:hypothetical protein
MGIKLYILAIKSRHSPALKGLLGPGDMITASEFMIL